MFIDHFHDIVRGHFVIRKLERNQSPGKMKECYKLLERNYV
jgi:hypothetical protein